MNDNDHSPKVSIYMTATCPYCIRAETLLRGKGVRVIETIRIDREPQRREEMIARSGRYTVPQVFIGADHGGGCDDLHALDDAGRLDRLLDPGSAA